jgi:hypothetical protein
MQRIFSGSTFLTFLKRAAQGCQFDFSFLQKPQTCSDSGLGSNLVHLVQASFYLHPILTIKSMMIDVFIFNAFYKVGEVGTKPNQIDSTDGR